MNKVLVFSQNNLVQQNYDNIEYHKWDPELDIRKVEGDYFCIMNKFNFRNSKIISRLVKEAENKTDVLGFYGDLFIENNNVSMPIYQLSYNPMYFSKFSIIGPIFLTRKVEPPYDVQNVGKYGLLEHIPEFLFYAYGSSRKT